MADVDLKVRVNKAVRISFTRGEDRDLEILLSDGAAFLPVDLTGGSVTLALPREGGGSIKRRTSALPVALKSAVTLNGFSVFTAASHGLVSGETVRLMAPMGTQLPAPFQESERYLVFTQTADTFVLTDMDGNGMVLAAPSSMTLSVMSPDMSILNATSGQVALRLTSAVSSQVSSGQGQAFQLTFTAADGLTRIYVANSLLDVFSQPCP